MFTAIDAEMRGRATAIHIVLSFKGDNKVSVLVTPTLTTEVAEKAPHLATPFVLTGTPAELDAGFATQFKDYSDVTASLQQQVSNQIAQVRASSEKAKEDAAKKTAAVQAKKAGTAPTTSATSAELASILGGEDADDENDDLPLKTADTPIVEVGPISADQLF
jgi:PRTRC genetic system protein E